VFLRSTLVASNSGFSPILTVPRRAFNCLLVLADEFQEQIGFYRRMMNHRANCFPGDILHIDYEETVSDLPAVARRLVDHIGLPWAKSASTSIKPNAPSAQSVSASVSQVREPVYQASIARWKHYEQHLTELFSCVPPRRDSAG